MLKMDYKDSMCDGARKYRITNNPDGTMGITDMTVYTQEGDRFGANDINDTNAAINRIHNTVVIDLAASEWSTEAPFSQRIAVAGIKATDEPQVCLYTPKTLTAGQVKQRQKLTGMITDGETEDGYITLYCGVKKPTVDFQIQLKGVSL